MATLKYLLSRLAEPSTWAAIGAAIGAAAVVPGPGRYVAIAAGIAGVLLPERVAPKP